MKMPDEKKVEDPYNPFDHRDVEKPNSDIRSTANLIKASLGSGLLAVPLAFSNSGWALGIVGTLLIGLMCAHCVHILVQVSRDCCKLEQKPQLGYSETCRAAFSNGSKSMRRYAQTAKIFVETSLFFTHIGICCVYTVLIADSLKQLIDRYIPGYILAVEMYCLILMVPLAMMTQIRHLKWLAPLSLVANILLVSTIGICLYFIFDGELDFSDKIAVNSLERFPAFLSTVIFAMEGIGIVMPIENNMKKPAHFLGCPGVLVVAMTTIVFLYGILGFFGYIRYGSILKGSITLNLPMDAWPAICAKSFIAISIMLTYPLQFYVIIDIFARYTDPYISDRYKSTASTIVRIVGVLVCGGIAMALPMLEQIISLVGAFFYSILGLIIPCIAETVFRWDNLGTFKWILWKNLVIIIVGLFCLVSGCTLAVQDIIKLSNSELE